MNIPLNNLNTNGTVKGAAFWQLGFRPCFLLANVFAVFIMILWLMIQKGILPPSIGYYGVNFWHAHEMIFGYGLMVIGGFLLTAIKNWTGIQTVQGGQLKLLMLAWILARVIVFIPNVPTIAMFLIDMLFPLLLVIFVAQPLLEVGNKRNYMMIVIVALMAVFNGIFHYAVINVSHSLASGVLLLALLLIMLLIIVMSGRVFPMFSQNGVTQRYQSKIYPQLERALPIGLIVLAFVWFLFPQNQWLLFVVAMSNALMHGYRLLGWYNPQIWQKPLVWVLHVGYGFLVLGFLFVAAAALLPWLYFVAIHVFTVGCLGLITMGMMARVSYGHTGRNLHQPPLVLWYCFSLLVLSAVTRVVLPLIDIMSYPNIILLSGVLWIVAYGLFVVRYFPIWLKPRIDGQPG